MNEYMRFSIVLLVICGVCGGALGVFKSLTAEPIKVAEKAAKERSVREIFGETAKLEEKVFKNDTETFSYYVVDLGGKTYYAVIGTATGYTKSVPIQVLVGIDADMNVYRIAVAQSSETPGLGENIREVEKDLYFSDFFSTRDAGAPDRDKRVFLRQFNDKKPEECKVTRDSGKIDAITGATITSRAVCTAVGDAVAKVRKITGKE
ncbi:MAG: RnfABCDGE type electron transport complex subunit G [Candidatus Brocadiia bacterium]